MAGIQRCSFKKKSWMDIVYWVSEQGSLFAIEKGCDRCFILLPASLLHRTHAQNA